MIRCSSIWRILISYYRILVLVVLVDSVSIPKTFFLYTFCFIYIFCGPDRASIVDFSSFDLFVDYV